MGLCVATLVQSTESAFAWPFTNTRAMVFSGFDGEADGVLPARVDTDSDDNLIVLGATAGQIQVDPSDSSVRVGNDRDATQYLAKYSPSGTRVWSLDWSHISGDIFFADMAITDTGDIILVGYTGAIGSDLDPSTSSSSPTVFANSAVILKISAAGRVMWTREISSTSGASLNYVRIAPNGNIVISGVFEGAMTIDVPGGASGLSFTSSVQADFFVAMLDSSGVEQWAATGSSDDRDAVLGLEVLSSGDVVVVTQVRDDGVAGDDITLTPGSGSPVSIAGSAGTNIVTLVWKLSSSGASQWTSQPSASTGTNESPQFFISRSNGNFLLTLMSDHILELSTTGSLLQTLQMNGDILGVDETTSGLTKIVGSFENTTDLDPTSGTDNKTVSDATYSDGYVTTLSSSLTYVSSVVYPGTGFQRVTHISATSDGGWIVSGLSAPTTLSLSTSTEAAAFTPATGASAMLFIVRYNADGSTTVPLTSTPTALSYTPDNKKITLTWTDMPYAARYVVKNAAGVAVCETTSNTCDVSGLRNGRIDTYTVTAYNYAGVASTTSTSVRAAAGFFLGLNTAKVRQKVALSKIVSTPSKGTKTWKVTSGACRISGKRLVMPTKKGRCMLHLSVGKKSPYLKMSIKVVLTVTKK